MEVSPSPEHPLSSPLILRHALPSFAFFGPLVQHHDLVGILDRRQVMGDER
jgi:hypothetical protein